MSPQLVQAIVLDFIRFLWAKKSAQGEDGDQGGWKVSPSPDGPWHASRWKSAE